MCSVKLAKTFSSAPNIGAMLVSGGMMKILITLALFSMLAGCCSGPETVYVPVSSCSEPPPMTMPVLAVDQLPERPETQQAIEAFANDHRTLKTTAKQCIILLDAYRK